MSAAAALAALLALGLPEGAARYRVELGGVTVGLAELELRCGRERCRARWETRLRLPEEAGGAVTTRRFETELDRAGRAVGRMRRTRDAEIARLEVPSGRVPAGLAEALLATAAGRGEAACVEVFEEETLATGRACGAWEGDTLHATVLGVEERVTFAADGLPETVALASDGARFLRDRRAAVPSRPPRLTARVAGPGDPARAESFCGVPVDPPPPRAPPGLPAPRAAGESCREKTAAYLATAAAAGHEGRTAIGVAWDGDGFVWHAWAELLADGSWVPVDPSFGELPARGPRFTVARHGAGRAAALAAGRRVLACWGRAGVLAR
ncbi:transglutaminase domain-containing protein [Anaeromyxobacter sp. Fw109-5]|uniref:transglutaminase domain-containing protein n=1 Tax=Anaeromyxobacter sp. (strain Fw109-5) TaxID=404589 RepID=UPI000158A45F|nr:transglutaminase domain-containing protein [Anaeromyxobacter sp. Fw109-5]ABS24395.1 transglutaminase-like protein [Anaeromyxobacter sp. Fw109-5]